MKGTCETCDYSIPIEGDPDGYLECHRHAIQAVGIDAEDGSVVSAFPVTEPTLWCGDWKFTAKVSINADFYENWGFSQASDQAKRAESRSNGRSRSNPSTNS